jgi:hypothetical protein
MAYKIIGAHVLEIGAFLLRVWNCFGEMADESQEPEAENVL